MRERESIECIVCCTGKMSRLILTEMHTNRELGSKKKYKRKEKEEREREREREREHWVHRVQNLSAGRILAPGWAIKIYNKHNKLIDTLSEEGREEHSRLFTQNATN